MGILIVIAFSKVISFYINATTKSTNQILQEITLRVNLFQLNKNYI